MRLSSDTGPVKPVDGMWQNAQASLRFTESCLSYSIALPSSSICCTWLSGGVAKRSSVAASIRSISLSTSAISRSTAADRGETVSSPCNKTAPDKVTATMASKDNSACGSFILDHLR